MDVFGGGAHVGDVGGDDEDRERKRDAEMEQNRSFWVFFGVGQGIGWTMAIMTSVDVSGPTRRGSTGGMCETVGYTSVAFFAMMYALLEESRAKCHWKRRIERRVCARRRAYGQIQKVNVAPATIGWACSGMCNCEGYVERPSTAVFVLAVLGLVVICIFGRETGF